MCIFSWLDPAATLTGISEESSLLFEDYGSLRFFLSKVEKKTVELNPYMVPNHRCLGMWCWILQSVTTPPSEAPRPLKCPKTNVARPRLFVLQRRWESRDTCGVVSLLFCYWFGISPQSLNIVLWPHIDLNCTTWLVDIVVPLCRLENILSKYSSTHIFFPHMGGPSGNQIHNPSVASTMLSQLSHTGPHETSALYLLSSWPCICVSVFQPSRALKESMSASEHEVVSGSVCMAAAPLLLLSKRSQSVQLTNGGETTESKSGSERRSTLDSPSLRAQLSHISSIPQIIISPTSESSLISDDNLSLVEKQGAMMSHE